MGVFFYHLQITQLVMVFKILKNAQISVFNWFVKSYQLVSISYLFQFLNWAYPNYKKLGK